jgi:hypothetical protein
MIGNGKSDVYSYVHQVWTILVFDIDEGITHSSMTYDAQVLQDCARCTQSGASRDGGRHGLN